MSRCLFYRRIRDMLKKKIFWYLFMMPGAILGWIFIIGGVVCPIVNETVRMLWLVITCIWVITHPLELILSIPIGQKAGCLLYTSDAADEEDSVDLGGRRIIKK